MYLWMKLLHILAVVMFIGNIATGVIAAIQAGLPLLRTGWIAWTLVLFTIAGLLFMFRVAPLQRQLRTLAEAGAASGSFDYDAYRRVALRWEIWGAGATLTPLLALALMVLKPAL